MLRYTCGRCANCCVEPVAPVTDADVRRLMKSTGLTADGIVRMWSSDEMDWDEEYEGRVLLSYGWRIMGLRKPRNGRCVFLTADNRCREYESRPMTCRTFPFEVELNAEGRFEEVGLHDEIGCRRRDGASMAPGHLLSLARQEQSEDDAYFDRVREWNSRMRRPVGANGGKPGFLQFLGLVPRRHTLNHQQY